MSYKGLCVGGARAGEWVSNDANTFFNGLHPGRNVLSDGTWLHVEMRLDTDLESLGTTYVHVLAEDVCEFWVPEGKTLTCALQELFRCYRRRELGQRPEVRAV